MNSPKNSPQNNLADGINQLESGRVRQIIFLLSASIGLMMTGYGLVMPIFAKRLGELGGGVEALGFMTMAFAIAQFVLAPFMGALADRYGRRPLILAALAGFAVANVAFLLARSTGAFIGIRLFEGAITAGLLPASMAIVGDTVPEKERARWVGTMMGCYSAGFIFGPAVGGLMYDHWGFAAPFAGSAALSLLGLLVAIILVPETKPRSLRQPAAPRQPVSAGQSGWLAALPRPLYLLGTLLLLDFIAVFGFAFIEPRMVFYFYQDLAFTTTQFGLIVGAYSLAMVLGQMTLGRLSDRLGRKPMIALGFGVNILFYLGMTVFNQFGLLFVTAIIAGLGSALLSPALSAFYIDITQEQHRSRILGLKESAAALGGVAGPLLVALVNPWTTPQGTFIVAAGLMGLAAVLAVFVLSQRVFQPEAVPVESIVITTDR